MFKDKVGQLFATPVYTEHLPYSQSTFTHNTRDYNSLHELVPAYVLTSSHTPTSLSSSGYSRYRRVLGSEISDLVPAVSETRPYNLVMKSEDSERSPRTYQQLLTNLETQDHPQPSGSLWEHFSKQIN